MFSTLMAEVVSKIQAKFMEKMFLIMAEKIVAR
jgi:hypothetical protein